MAGDDVTLICVEFVKDVICSPSVTFLEFGLSSLTAVPILMVQVALLSMVESPVVGVVVKLLSADSTKPSAVTLDCDGTVTRSESSNTS